MHEMVLINMNVSIPKRNKVGKISVPTFTKLNQQEILQTIASEVDILLLNNIFIGILQLDFSLFDF